MGEMSFDIIGDIHGQYKKLTELLRVMGYRESAGCYRHASRKVLFLGDFIDRGPDQRAVLDLVMAMVSQGQAQAVMGNHEYNALAFHTPDPQNLGQWLRPRTDKNIEQHFAFLQEYVTKGETAALDEVLDFFRSLPLWLELPGLRMVHACWDPKSIAFLRSHLDKGNCINERVLLESSRKGSAAYNAIETILKGPEVALPPGVLFVDKYGSERKKMRLRWWRSKAVNLSEQVVDRGDTVAHLRGLAPVPVVGYGKNEPPLFFGHYWFNGTPRLVRKNMVCLDYSAAKSGPLVAYRWNGEQELNVENFCYIELATSNDKRQHSINRTGSRD